MMKKHVAYDLLCNQLNEILHNNEVGWGVVQALNKLHEFAILAFI